jgi:DNA polymerase-3 subunit delta'
MGFSDMLSTKSFAHMILGHERQIGYMEKVMERGCLSHGYLFSGPEHIGKFTIAMALGRSLLCEAPVGRNNRRGFFSRRTVEAFCTQCPSCRMIERGQHPDFFVLPALERREPGDEKEIRDTISINDIRELRRKCSLASATAGPRLGILDRVEKMGSEAANAFLKLLEEPGKNLLFFLITSQELEVLPTIRSRVQILRFGGVPSSVLDEFLSRERGIRDQAARKELLRCAGGRPGFLFRFLADEDAFARERNFRRALSSALRAGAPELLRLSERIAASGELREKTLCVLLEILREQWRAEAARKNGERARGSEVLREAIAIGTAMDRFNLHPRLALDLLFLRARRGIFGSDSFPCEPAGVEGQDFLRRG